MAEQADIGVTLIPEPPEKPFYFIVLVFPNWTVTCMSLEEMII